MKALYNQIKRSSLLAIILLLAACSPENEPASVDNSSDLVSSNLLKKQDPEKVNIFKGTEVQYGSGKARSWISINHNGFPIEIGFELSEDIFTDLSLLNSGHEMTTVLPLHQKAKEVTPFEHLGLNYQPNGHGPVFWDTHFDLHFYTITNEERMAIPAYNENDPGIVEAYTFFPDMSKMPTDYFKFPGEGGAFPMMGKHWVPKDFETAYNPFTKVMIYGSYNQKNIFIEPMITVDYLMSGDSFSGNYSQPVTFEESNNYPTKYNIYHDLKHKKVYITLSDFVKR